MKKYSLIHELLYFTLKIWIKPGFVRMMKSYKKSNTASSVPYNRKMSDILYFLPWVVIHKPEQRMVRFQSSLYISYTLKDVKNTKRLLLTSCNRRGNDIRFSLSGNIT